MKKLNLSSNSFGENEISCFYFGKMLKINKSITSLNLSDNEIGKNENPTKYIFEGLIQNNTIKKIILHRNSFRNNNIFGIYLGNLLQNNSSITYLDLRGCNFKDNENSKAFCEGLSKNNSIQTLILCSVHLANFYEDFFKVLKNNKSITNLNISYNDLSDVENQQLIFDTIEKNETLLEIDLSECFQNYGYEDCESLAKAFSKNKSIQKIIFLDNKDEDMAKEAIHDFFQSSIVRNKNIIEFKISEEPLTIDLEFNKFLWNSKKSNYISLLSILARL